MKLIQLFRNFAVFGLAASGAMSFAGRLGAAEKAGIPMDPKAEQILRKATTLIKDARSLSMDLTMMMKMHMRGTRQEMPSTYAVALQRPNRYAFQLKDGKMGGTIVSDGKTLFTYLPVLKQYSEAPAPKSLDELIEQGETQMIGGGAGGVLNGLLLSKDPYQQLLEGVTNVQYLGAEKLGGQECHRVKLVEKGFAWDIWIDAGAQPLFRKMFADMGAMMRALAADRPGGRDSMKNMEMEMTLTFTNWAINPVLKPDTFAFVPPAGAKKADSLFGETEKDEDEVQLVGKPAPAFKLDLLEGGQFDIAAQKGKKIVVLDFWATWCGPCVRAMPVLIDVTESFKDKGVVFVGVNHDEETKVIKEFLDRKKFNLAVGLDPDSKVAELYGVTGIPQTVIIDQQGVVQAVHIGYLPNLKQKLTQELEALVAGKSLLPPETRQK